MVNATQLCDALAIPLFLKPKRELYDHGSGHACADAKAIVCSWDLVVNDVNRITTVDIVVFQRPCDTEERKFLTYIIKDDGGNERIRFDIFPHARSTVASLLGAKYPRQEINTVKQVHQFTHASSNETRRLLDDANMTTAGVVKACEKVAQACEICASSGRPIDMKKVSLSHVNEAFNQEIQADS